MMKIGEAIRRCAECLPASFRSVGQIRRELRKQTESLESVGRAVRAQTSLVSGQHESIARAVAEVRDRADLLVGQHESIAKAVEVFSNRDFAAIQALGERCRRLEDSLARQDAFLRQTLSRATFLVDDRIARSDLAPLADALSQSVRDMLSLPRESARVVAFITTPNYLEATRCAISSLLRHRRSDVRYDVRVIGPELSSSDKEALDVFGGAVTVLSPDPAKYRGMSAEACHVSPVALFKFDLAELVPDVDRLLYLDSDVLVLDDISEIWETDLADRYAAVVRDYAGSVRERHHEKMRHADYFNSGVMFLNLAAFRETGMRGKLMEARQSKEFPQHFMDQDAFNLALGENVVFLPPKYNMMFSNNQPPFGNAVPPNEFYGLPLPEYTRQESRPKILHLTNWAKPWDTERSDFYEKWVLENALLSALQPEAARK